jgi:hypothetical protein
VINVRKIRILQERALPDRRIAIAAAKWNRLGARTNKVALRARTRKMIAVSPGLNVRIDRCFGDTHSAEVTSSRARAPRPKKLGAFAVFS